MATTPDARGIRLFDYAKQFAEPLKEAIRARAAQMAAEAGIEVEYMKKPTTYRKEDRIREIVAERGTHRDSCTSSRSWSFAGRIGPGTDQNLFEILCRGEFFIQDSATAPRTPRPFPLGADLAVTQAPSPSRDHQKVGRTHKHYLTEPGRYVAVALNTVSSLTS